MQWDNLWVNVHLALMQGDEADDFIIDGAIATVDGKIAWIGPRWDLPAEPDTLAKQLHDGQGAWLLPAFIDCHTHLVYGGSRHREYLQRLQGVSYLEIQAQGGGIARTVHATRKLSEAQLFEISLPRMLSMKSQGVATVEIKSGYGLDYETEARMLRVAKKCGQETGMRVQTTYLGAHALPSEFRFSDEYMDVIIEDYLPRLQQEGLIDAVDIYCEQGAFSLEDAERLFEAAAQLGLAIKCHAEQFSDLGASRLSVRHHALSVDHLEYASEKSIQALAMSDTVAVLLPGAYYYLRQQQKPPVAQLRDAKVAMAIATDCNPGTSPFTSLLWVMQMATALFEMTPYEVLLAVTKHAAQALGLGQTIGQLRLGYAADFVLWQVESPAECCALVGGEKPAGIIIAGCLQTPY